MRLVPNVVCNCRPPSSFSQDPVTYNIFVGEPGFVTGNCLELGYLCLVKIGRPVRVGFVRGRIEAETVVGRCESGLNQRGRIPSRSARSNIPIGKSVVLWG